MDQLDSLKMDLLKKIKRFYYKRIWCLSFCFKTIVLLTLLPYISNARYIVTSKPYPYREVVVTDVNNDSVIDDDIKNCIDSLGSADGVIFIPKGTHYIKHPIVLPGNIILKGETHMGSVIKTAHPFYGNSMIRNFKNDTPGSDEFQHYNQISSLYLHNTTTNKNMVIVWMVNLYQNSYIKDINIKNEGVVRGGLWYTCTYGTDPSPYRNSGGQVLIENIDLLGGTGIGGYCLEENVKIMNSGGLWCRNWNINPQKPNNGVPAKPFVSLEVQTNVLHLQDAFIEQTPGNFVPSLQIIGSNYATLHVSDCDILANRDTSKLAIEIIQNDATVSWCLENINLKNTANGHSEFDKQIRLVLFDKRKEEIIEDITHITIFTKALRQFDGLTLRVENGIRSKAALEVNGQTIIRLRKNSTDSLTVAAITLRDSTGELAIINKDAGNSLKESRIGYYTGGDTLNPKMVILKNGRVGIGTSKPSKKLHVKEGDVEIENGNLILFGKTVYDSAGFLKLH